VPVDEEGGGDVGPEPIDDDIGEETIEGESTLDVTQPIVGEKVETTILEDPEEDVPKGKKRSGRPKKKIAVEEVFVVDLNKRQEILPEDNPPIEKEVVQDDAKEDGNVANESTIEENEEDSEGVEATEGPDASEEDYVDEEEEEDDDAEEEHNLDASVYDQEDDDEETEIHVKSARLREKQERSLLEERQYSLRPKKDVSLLDPVISPPKDRAPRTYTPSVKKSRPKRVAIGQEPKRKSHPDDTDVIRIPCLIF
jgi:hypothetical protein